MDRKTGQAAAPPAVYIACELWERRGELGLRFEVGGVVFAGDGEVVATIEIEDGDVVFTRVQPDAGEIESACGTDAPEAAEEVSVNPEDAFAELLRVEVGCRREC